MLTFTGTLNLSRFRENWSSTNATRLKIRMDVTSTQEINFPNFKCWEIKDAPVKSP